MSRPKIGSELFRAFLLNKALHRFNQAIGITHLDPQPVLQRIPNHQPTFLLDIQYVE